MKKPYKCQLLPIEIDYTSKFVNLLSEATTKYGEYKGLLDSIGIDKSKFILSIIKKDSFKSTQIEGTNISQSELFEIEFKSEINDDYKEVQNYYDCIQYGEKHLIENDLRLTEEAINNMHRILLNSVRGGKKNPGKYRTTQNWIGLRGVGIESAEFIPPEPIKVNGLMNNLIEFINDSYGIPPLVALAIVHAQFETIHPYNDGNGRLGRALIPLQLAIITEDDPILFLSETIELYKPTYGRTLNAFRRGGINDFIEFFLQCIVDQCTVYIYRINQIKQLKTQDLKKMEEIINGKYVNKLYDILLKRVVIKTEIICNELEITKQTARKYINQLIDNEILIKSTGNRYIYKELYDIFVNVDS